MQEEVSVYDRNNNWDMIFKGWENKGRVKFPLWSWIVGLLILAIPFFNLFCSLIFIIFYIIQTCEANDLVKSRYNCSRYKIALFNYIGEFFNKKY
jgi:hypothetical protein